MNIRIFVAAVLTTFIGSGAFGQMGYGGGMSSNQQPSQSREQPQTTTTSKTTTTPVGVKGYLDSQIAGSSDKKFHMTVQGKDLALTPMRIGEAKKQGGGKSATIVDMKGTDGKMYEVEFESSNGRVTGASLLVHKTKA
jgi:hypothetical protein